MGGVFYPDKYIKEALPESFWKNEILKSGIEPKKTMLRAIVRSTLVSGRQLDATVYKVVREYQARAEELKEAGVRAFVAAAVNDEALLKQRIENLVVYDEIQHLKEEHAGEFYRWLPSEAENPDPEHQLLYGKIFRVGEGDKDGYMPGERYGCQCGIEFLGNSDKEKILSRMDKRFVKEAEMLYGKAASGTGFASSKPIPIRRIEGKEAARIKAATGLDLKGFEHKLTGTDLRHIFLQHGNLEKEALRGQLPVRAADIVLIPEITKNYDSLKLSPKRAKDGKKVLIYKKKIGNEYYYLEGISAEKKDGLTPKTMYIKKK